MHVVILGCGRVGSILANLLAEEGHDVAIIDRNGDSFRRLSHDFNGVTILGTGMDEDILKQAGIEQADAFIAVTNGDNTNIMTAQIARERFKVPKILARIYDPLRAYAYKELGIDTLCGTTLVAGLIKDYLMGREWGRVEDYLKTPEE